MAHKVKVPISRNLVERIFPWIGAITVIIAIPVSEDPVNIWKLLAILGSAGVLVGFLLVRENRKYLGTNASKFLIGFFLLSLLIPLIFSGAPVLQQIYGVSGRLTGALTLTSFSIFFILACSGFENSTYKRIIAGIVFAGSYNLVLCILENFGIEPLQYDNTYKVPLGSLGNPNFISAFLALSTAVSFSLILDKSLSNFVRILIAFQVPISIFELMKVGSKQGFYVLIMGFLLTTYLRFREQISNFVRIFIHFLTFIILINIALGFLNKGPISTLVYKDTAKFRYEYWSAGISMAKSHFFAGVGLNSYGDWYRKYRGAGSIISPGKDVATNVSHNVFIDYLATGGIIHFTAYVALNILVILNIRKFLKYTTTFDPLFSALVVGWVSYQLQALISVDNLGLAIWGWILGGSIIGYTARNIQKKFDETSNTKLNVRKERRSRSRSSSDRKSKEIIFGFLGGLAMVLLTTPLLNASIYWKNAILSRQVENIVLAGKMRPLDESRLVKAVGLLSNNEQYQVSLDLALGEIVNYPRSVALRYYVIQNPKVTLAMKRKFIEQNRLLDPLNPDWK